MSVAAFNPNLPVLFVQSDWSDAENVREDFESQWGIEFPESALFDISLWEGLGDPDDYAVLTVTSGTFSYSSNFSSTPDVDSFVFVVDFDVYL